MPLPEVSARIGDAVAALRDDYVSVSMQIHRNPELRFEERAASALLIQWLEDEGFAVESPVAGLETAFVATSVTEGGGNGPPSGPNIAYLLEYDALPGVGHACGHNLIAAGGVVAAAALRRALPDHPGTISVIGTPGEEGGGGKVIELEAGVFDNVDAALMFHPGDRTLALRHALASVHLTITFRGVAAHSARTPERGRNALAAMILFYNAVDALRQHVGQRARMHGVIRKGGDAPNVVPDHTEAEFLVRDVTMERALALTERVRDCARGAALATGTTSEVEFNAPTYAERKNSHTMADRTAQYLRGLGQEVAHHSLSGPSGSSDIGNVSLALPTIHPYVQIAERGTPSHSDRFREAAATPEAHAAALTMAEALANTGADLLTDPEFLAAVAHEFHTSGPDVQP